ncbi:MAG: phosphoglycerate kinase [SAR202 cluster bacterium]|nr:phosphoglycerate kinase [Chloroflexota bacterium]MQG22657.1 phosphoglycerate kinase [SAR202 cluster bacterium]
MIDKTVRDIELSGKIVLVRVDFNVPFKPDTNEISSLNRIIASLPTIRYLIEENASVVLCSHLGRPKGVFRKDLSLNLVLPKLQALLGVNVKFSSSLDFSEIKKGISELLPKEVMLLENLRFYPEEELNDKDFSKKLANLADVFVNDAFGVSHRPHASVYGITNWITSVSGLLLEKEYISLGQIFESHSHPVAIILGGGKVSDKINIVKKLLNVVDKIFVGGGMAATFLKSKGLQVGNSIVDDQFIGVVNKLVSDSLYIPLDVVVSDRFEDSGNIRISSVNDIKADEMIMDIGPKTIDSYIKEIEKSKTIFWNGPMGVYEWNNYSKGTRAIAEKVSEDKFMSVIGGGSTVDAISKFGYESLMTHISTGGGASLEFLEGQLLPGIEPLLRKNSEGD